MYGFVTDLFRWLPDTDRFSANCLTKVSIDKIREDIEDLEQRRAEIEKQLVEKRALLERKLHAVNNIGATWNKNQ